jgi:hypothetical protein
VEEIDIDSKKYYKFQRYDGIKEFADKSMIPAPFVVFEYIFRLIRFVRNVVNGTLVETPASFSKN